MAAICLRIINAYQMFEFSGTKDRMAFISLYYYSIIDTQPNRFGIDTSLQGGQGIIAY